jgi:hypothetical protein
MKRPPIGGAEALGPGIRTSAGRSAGGRTYKNIMLLGKDGGGKTVDLGLVHSSAAPSIGQLIVERLGQAGDIEEKGVSPNFLLRYWPGIRRVEHQVC